MGKQVWPELGPVQRTPEGWPIIVFGDRQGRMCSVQSMQHPDSTQPVLVLRAEAGDESGAAGPPIVLDPLMASTLGLTLQRWCATGKLEP